MPSIYDFTTSDVAARRLQKARRALVCQDAPPRRNSPDRNCKNDQHRATRSHLRFFDFASFDFARSASSARSLVMRWINLTGTGRESGKRTVPLLTSYDASSFFNAVTTRSVTG